MIMRIAALAALAILSAGCGDDAAQKPAVPVTKTTVVKAADFGADWPLVAPEATIGCEPPSKAFLDLADRRCALNGKALSAGMERCDDASKTGNAVAFGVFIEKALALCPTHN
ncbi:MAG: hypothetical protein AB1642_13380 [Pseudomonadota bacterium]